jgi:Dolichyl-phosphate-mannose-protein mannosyltransferase
MAARPAGVTAAPVATGSVFLVALFVLALGTNQIPFTASYQDRISHIRSQDEATYGHVAIQMLQTGDWLTPRLDGRLFLMKPPLFYWLSAASVKLFGFSRLALRTPSVVAGALAAALVFAWCWRFRSVYAGLCAAALLLSNSVWETMSRLACMDALVSFCILGAIFFLARDPALERRSSVLGFGISTGAAILTKSAAGAIPLLVLAGFAIASRKEKPISVRRIVYACAVIFAVAAPWHLYQIAVHPRWFYTEYIQAQLFGFGLHPPVEPTESQLWFYARRLFLTDPVLSVVFLLAIPRLIRSIRERHAPALIVLVWMLAVALTLAAFRAQNFLYATLLIPPLCILAAGYLPAPGRVAPLLLAALVVAGVGKAAAEAPWDLAFYRVRTPDTQLDLRSYAAKARPNELISVQPDDEFYTLLLPIPGVRYCWIDPSHFAERYAPHLARLGFVMPAERFIDLQRDLPRYQAMLEEWGLGSAEAVPTAIMAGSINEVPAVISSKPESDFYVPVEFARTYNLQISATHRIQPVSATRAFLLARKAPATHRQRFLPFLPRDW